MPEEPSLVDHSRCVQSLIEAGNAGALLVTNRQWVLGKFQDETIRHTRIEQGMSKGGGTHDRNETYAGQAYYTHKYQCSQHLGPFREVGALLDGRVGAAWVWAIGYLSSIRGRQSRAITRTSSFPQCPCADVEVSPLIVQHAEVQIPGGARRPISLEVREVPGCSLHRGTENPVSRLPASSNVHFLAEFSIASLCWQEGAVDLIFLIQHGEQR